MPDAPASSLPGVPVPPRDEGLPEVRVATFASVHHPGEASAAAVWARALGPKIAVVALAVLTLAAGRALLHLPIAATLGWGGLVGGLAAAYLTRLHLERRPVEVRVAGPFAAVRTALDVLSGRPETLTPLLDVRRGAPVTTVTLGDDVWELDDADWPDLPALLAALSAARRAARQA